MSDDRERLARSFGAVADAYDRGRPGYPAEAVSWLVTGSVDDHSQQLTVLELGAGTGKLTRTLVAQGHDVHATEPDEAMLAILRRDLPDVRTSATGAHDIPVEDGTVDVVVAAQCHHWFDDEEARAEIARVLRPKGHLALVWNQRDERIPWVRKLGRVIGTQDQLDEPAAGLEASPLFGPVEEHTAKHWQVVDRRSIVDLATSRSTIAVMDDAERQATIEALLALYDDYGRGMDGMQLPYLSRCFRARVLPRTEPAPAPAAEPADLLFDSAATPPGSDATTGAADGPRQRPVRRDPALDLPALALDPLLQPTVPISVADLVGAGLSRGRTRSEGADLADSADRMPRVAFRGLDDPDDDTGMLLIDFR